MGKHICFKQRGVHISTKEWKINYDFHLLVQFCAVAKIFSPKSWKAESSIIYVWSSSFNYKLIAAWQIPIPILHYITDLSISLSTIDHPFLNKPISHILHELPWVYSAMKKWRWPFFRLPIHVQNNLSILLSVRS